jgi:hypothetical protein
MLRKERSRQHLSPPHRCLDISSHLARLLAITGHSNGLQTRSRYVYKASPDRVQSMVHHVAGSERDCLIIDSATKDARSESQQPGTAAIYPCRPGLTLWYFQLRGVPVACCCFGPNRNPIRKTTRRINVSLGSRPTARPPGA